MESARGEMLGGLHPDVHHRVAAAPEVGAVSRIRLGHWKHRGSTEALTAVEPETLPAVAQLDLVAGSLDALRDGGVVISETIAEAKGLGVGDTLTMTVPRGGDQQVPVVGILEKEGQWAMRTGYLVSVDTAMRFFTEDVDATLLVRFADGVEHERGMAALREAIAGHADARAMDEAEARRARTARLDQALGLVRVLPAFTLLIALLGIANTLALAVVERRRELALLRAVGMSRSQLRSAVRLEAALLAGIGALSGTALGVAGARLALAVFAGQLRAPMVLPAEQLLVAVGAMVVAAILAAGGPARRAAKLDILAAVAR